MKKSEINKNRFTIPYISAGVSFICSNKKHLEQLNHYSDLLKPLILRSRHLGYEKWKIFVRKHSSLIPDSFNIKDHTENDCSQPSRQWFSNNTKTRVLLKLPVYPLSRFNEFEHFDIICCSDKLGPITHPSIVEKFNSVFFLADSEKTFRFLDHIEAKYRNSEVAIRQATCYLKLPEERQRLINSLFPLKTRSFTNSYPSDYPQYFHPQACPQRGDVVISGGVSASAASELEICRAVGTSGKVYAFEPDPAGARAAGEFFASQANIKNIEIIPLGLWNKKETVTFVSGLGGSSYVKENAENSYSAEKHQKMIKQKSVSENLANEITINMTSIDEFVKERGLNRLNFIKLDIEGSELAALEGARQSFLKFAPRFAICIYHKPEDIWTIPQFIKDLEKDGLSYELYFGTHSYDPSREFVLYGRLKNEMKLNSPKA